MLLHNPDVMKDQPEMKDWTDSRFIDELQKEQEKENVNIGIIPAAVYQAAIEHYSFKSLHNPIRENVEEGRVDTNVERFALRPMLTDPTLPGKAAHWPQKAICDSTIRVLGGSGSFIYKASSHSTVDQFLRGSEDGNWGAVKHRWRNLKGVHGCGVGWAHWIENMKKVIDQAKEEKILEKDPDSVLRLPAYYHVIRLGNLNTINALTPEGEQRRLTCNKVANRRPLTTFEGFMENGLLQHELDELMSYLGRFKSAIYVRTAPASRWNMPPEVDRITDEIVKRATEHKVISVKGEWFWNSFVHFGTEKTHRWHHQRVNPADGRFLHYHWDLFIFRIISFAKACTIHPAILDSICVKVAYNSIYEEVKRDEVSDGLRQSSGGMVKSKVEDVATDVLAASATYSAALGNSHDSEGQRKSHKKRWADAPSVQEEQEDQLDDEPLDEEPLDPAAEAAKDEGAIQQCLDNLGQVAQTLMSTLEKAARDDIELRNSVPGAEASSNSKDPRINETFGLDHKALEGFENYEESLRVALIEEMTSIKKKTAFVGEVPIPPTLQEEKRKDRELELTRAAKEAEQKARTPAAKAKARPRNKSPKVPGVSGGRAELESQIAAQGKLYADAAKKVVVTSSKCDDLGKAIMYARQADDRRKGVKLACQNPDEIVKIDFGDGGWGLAYTKTGVTYDKIHKSLGDPIFLSLMSGFLRKDMPGSSLMVMIRRIMSMIVIL